MKTDILSVLTLGMFSLVTVEADPEQTGGDRAWYGNNPPPPSAPYPAPAYQQPNYGGVPNPAPGQPMFMAPMPPQPQQVIH